MDWYMSSMLDLLKQKTCSVSSSAPVLSQTGSTPQRTGPPLLLHPIPPQTTTRSNPTIQSPSVLLPTYCPFALGQPSPQQHTATLTLSPYEWRAMQLAPRPPTYSTDGLYNYLCGGDACEGVDAGTWDGGWAAVGWWGEGLWIVSCVTRKGF
ncbi:hypothetical protein P171DRAFT_264201 [Karstenula rhodostoma CBS 690.94]|uniref:Uncharacterized protein n=1 Tax=Karstenula rhodostoma CBS 690.94 TaxID=1392251 RepID=A0A9P4UCL4_9PLEO|nr:hypothetical protein P171DRAFT_264201 [Karstenula rhodostoma CBS 690.94]